MKRSKIAEKLKEKREQRQARMKQRNLDIKARLASKREERRQKMKFIFTKIKGQRKFIFNPFKASSWNNSNNFEEEVLPVNDFTVEAFEELRTHNTEESALEQLREVGVDISTIDPNDVKEESRVCFICCNSYTKPQYKLGVGPINDSITVAANHKYMGYTVYFLHNPTSEQFLQYLEIILQKSTDYLTVYYTGHGSSVTDKSGDEEDGKDEVMVFDDNYILDDVLAELIQEFANGKTKVILLNDCCHSGTLWDIPLNDEEAQEFPANVICISAADDDETAKQGKQGNNDQGFFTFFFFQEVRRNRAINPTDIQNRVSSQLVNFHQCVIVSPTRPELMNQPLFPQ